MVQVVRVSTRLSPCTEAAQPMVTPKPHWNLFLRWLSKEQSARDRGRGSSFFSSVAPTTQLLSTEPAEKWRNKGFIIGQCSTCLVTQRDYSTIGLLIQRQPQDTIAHQYAHLKMSLRCLNNNKKSNYTFIIVAASQNKERKSFRLRKVQFLCGILLRWNYRISDLFISMLCV